MLGISGRVAQRACRATTGALLAATLGRPVVREAVYADRTCADRTANAYEHHQRQGQRQGSRARAAVFRGRAVLRRVPALVLLLSRSLTQGQIDAIRT